MCGIVGIIARNMGNFSAHHPDIFKELLFANELRGSHGTGMFWDNNGKCKNLKSPVPSSFFIHDKKVTEALSEIYQKSTFAIGHNRHATKGGLNMESTHPFRVGHITLIHNGTLLSHKHMKDVPVDSEAITHSIAEKGADSTIKDLDGAFALVWFDSKEGTLNFIRNEERPLYLLETLGAWVISSEVKLAEWIISRNKSHSKFNELCPAGTLYTYDIYTRALTTRKVDIRAKHNYWDDYVPGTYGGYKYMPAAKPIEPAKKIENNLVQKKCEVTPLLTTPKNKDNTFAYKLGNKIIFSPIQVIEAGRVFYLEGIIEDDRKEDLEVRFYSNDKRLLLSMMKESLLEGIIMQVYYRKGEERYIVKEVKTILKTAEIPLLSVS